MLSGTYLGGTYLSGLGLLPTLSGEPISALPSHIQFYALAWHVWVDWNDDGAYDADEGARLKGVIIERGRDNYFDDPVVGNCELRLTNHDRRYDKWYTGSPLYPHIGVGKKTQVSVDYMGVNHILFTGRIDKPGVSGIRASGAQGGPRTATLTISDGWQWLKDQRVSYALQQSKDTQTLISTLLNAAGWVQGAGLWVLGTGLLGLTTKLGGLLGDNVDLGSDLGDIIPYWWVEDEEVAQNLFDLVNTHFGRVHISANGTLTWRTLAGDNGTAVELTLTNAVLQEMEVEQTWADVKDRIEIRTNPRALSALGDVWSSSETLVLQPSAVQSVTAEYTNSSGERVPAINIVTPASGVDFIANSAADGTGTDLTGLVTVTHTVYSFNTILVVTNNAGVPAHFITLKLRGQLVEALDSQLATAEGTTTLHRTLETDLRWQQKFLIAQDLANFALAAFNQERDIERLRFEHSNVALIYDLGTKIQDSTTQGPGGEFRIAKVMHETEDEHCQKLLTTWTLYRLPNYSPAGPINFWMLGSATLSQLGSTTKLGV